MAPARDDSLKRTGGSKPDFLGHVETTPLKDVNHPADRRGSPSPHPTNVAPDPTQIEPALTPPSIFRSLKRDDQRTETSASDGRWTLTVWMLLLSGIVVGAIVGTVVAANSFP